MIHLFEQHPYWWGFVVLGVVYFVMQGLVWILQAWAKRT